MAGKFEGKRRITITASEKRLADRMLKEILGEGSKNVSRIDRDRADEIAEAYKKYLNRNDGGIAKKTRVF